MSYCPFQVGDEVVCVDAQGAPELSRGASYIVERIVAEGDAVCCHDGSVVFVECPGFSVWVVGGEDFRDPNNEFAGYSPTRFRKAQKPRTSLSIEQFLTIKPGQFEEPRRTVTPAKPKEKAQ